MSLGEILDYEFMADRLNVAIENCCNETFCPIVLIHLDLNFFK